MSCLGFGYWTNHVFPCESCQMTRAITVYVFSGWQLFNDTSLKPLLTNKIAFWLLFCCCFFFTSDQSVHLTLKMVSGNDFELNVSHWQQHYSRLHFSRPHIPSDMSLLGFNNFQASRKFVRWNTRVSLFELALNQYILTHSTGLQLASFWLF